MDNDIQDTRRRQLRRWIAENFDGRQVDFLREAARRGQRISQGEVSGLLGTKSFAEKRARNLERQAAMPPMYLDQADGVDGASEQYPAANDVTAIWMTLRSLVRALTANAPTAAKAFAALLHEQAKAARSEELSGLVSQVQSIVSQGPNKAEAAVARALQLYSANPPTQGSKGRSHQT